MSIVIIKPNGCAIRMDKTVFATIYQRHRWWADPQRGVMRHRSVPKDGPGPKTIYLHREILRPGDGFEVDHRNRNPLDNRMKNLRPAMRVENCRNTGIRSNNRSGYRGVSWEKNLSKWRSQGRLRSGRSKLIGLFDCKHAAAHAFNEFVRQEHGEFAFQNTIKEDVSYTSYKPLP